MNDFLSKIGKPWEFLFKVSLAVFPIVVGGLIAYAVWITTTLFTVQGDVSINQMEISHLKQDKRDLQARLEKTETFMNQGPRYTKQQADDREDYLIKLIQKIDEDHASKQVLMLNAVSDINVTLGELKVQTTILKEEVERLRNVKDPKTP